MSVKIRLQRHGKKGKPFYWIVAADARSKRDGKYLEKLGTYNPNTNPATVELDVDGTVKWLQNGAQPTDTARTLLSYKGALLKHHLAGGVSKGAFSEEEAEKKFQAWLDEKAGLVSAKVDGLAKADADAKEKALDAEKEVNAKRKATVIEAEEALKAEAVAEEAQAATVEEVATKETIDDVVAEATEAPAKEETSEEVAAEVTEEAVEEDVETTKETVEEVVAEATEETPTEEASEEATEEKKAK